MLHAIGITVKKTVINGIYDSYKRYYKNINTNCMINFNMYSHTWNLNSENSRPMHTP